MFDNCFALGHGRCPDESWYICTDLGQSFDNVMRKGDGSNQVFLEEKIKAQENEK